MGKGRTELTIVPFTYASAIGTFTLPRYLQEWSAAKLGSQRRVLFNSYIRYVLAKLGYRGIFGIDAFEFGEC